MAPLAWLAADCPRLPAPDCVWLLEGSRVDAGLVCGMTLVVTVYEVAGRYLAGGWWIRRESGMERRAHRLAAIVKGLLDLVPFEQLHTAIIFPRAIVPTPEGRR